MESSESHSHICKARAMLVMLGKGSMIEQLLPAQLREHTLTDTPFLKTIEPSYLRVSALMCVS